MFVKSKNLDTIYSFHFLSSSTTTGPKVIVSVDLDTDAPVSVEIKVTEKKADGSLSESVKGEGVAREKEEGAACLGASAGSSDNQPVSQGSKGKTLDQKGSKPVAVSENNDEEWEQIPTTVDELASDESDPGPWPPSHSPTTPVPPDHSPPGRQVSESSTPDRNLHERLFPHPPPVRGLCLCVKSGERLHVPSCSMLKHHRDASLAKNLEFCPNVLDGGLFRKSRSCASALKRADMFMI